MYSLSQLRTSFLEYFQAHDHSLVASAPLIPTTDASLLFTNSGMVQFKNVFTGKEQHNYSRAVTAQKCIRAGGKHNDLENVGYTERHHTFFEMLGNFAFGDYFKYRAIELAWNYLVTELALPKSRLLVTIYHDDEQAYAAWRKVAGLTDDRIIRIATKDNFWQMGETGPCGPCSEIFYDHGDKVPGGLPGSPDEDGPRYTEIWNLVFMQFLQNQTGREQLPRPSIDTGMGLERVTAVLQGKFDNYKIDLFQNLIDEVALNIKVKPTSSNQSSFKVIVDHLRSICFLLAEGVMPSNTGRGYVLRRIMRRAMRHTFLLGCSQPILYEHVHAVVAMMGEHYRELVPAEQSIRQTLQYEEEKFGALLQRGMKKLAIASKQAKTTLPGTVAFELYDTYGFPLDLTQDIVQNNNLTVDVAGFDQAMARQRQRARASWHGSGGHEIAKIWYDLPNQIEETEFLGYENLQVTATIEALILHDKQQDSLANIGTEAIMIVNQTAAYPESGGQLGDIGLITAEAGQAELLNTTRVNNLIRHHIRLQRGVLCNNDQVVIKINPQVRKQRARHHSLTHLLHAALVDTLGEHVAQSGSQVSEHGLRFDFSHSRPVSSEQLTRIENAINQQIWQNSAVETQVMSQKEAIASGAKALFGEKYADEVRVVSMGRLDDRIWSRELCGGTHVYNTGEIGTALITRESAIASGIRRVEAVAAEPALLLARAQQQQISQLKTILKSSSHALTEKVADLVSEHKALQQQVKRQQLQQAISASLQTAKSVNNIKVICHRISGISGSEQKRLLDQLVQNIGSGIVVLAFISESKVSVLVAVSVDLQQQGVDAGQLIVPAAQVFAARSGGRAGLAQTGGNDPAKIDAAFNKILATISEIRWD